MTSVWINRIQSKLGHLFLNRRAAIAAILLVTLGTFYSPAHAIDNRIIVKYRSTTDSDKGFQLNNRKQIRALGQPSIISDDIEVIKSSAPLADLLAKARNNPAVEYAVPDFLRFRRAVPNDPLYTDQWYLNAPSAPNISAINAEQAWDITKGANGTVIAVLDTGIRGDHPDFINKLLPGYDFINTPSIAGDGDGRDTDPSDPGDFVTAADINNAQLRRDCEGADFAIQNSSWHGTRVAGLIGAQTNNRTGMAGTGWSLRVLPVRVLGKCGGYDSDIITAMRWSAGIPVAGIPNNANPARVINMSLGSEAPCTRAYTDAINDLMARGVVVVVAAGNGGATVDAPGNCPGAVAVGGVRHVGTKVGYSGMGKEISISAPAGNCVNSSGNCLNSLLTTSNSGNQTPINNIYTDQTNYNIGTSFAAPLVSAAYGLLFDLQPKLTPTRARSLLENNVTAFGRDPSQPNCPSVTTGITAGECNCVNGYCGAGILNIGKAVAAANILVAADIQINNALQPNSVVNLQAVNIVTQGTISKITWSLVNAPANASITGNNVSAILNTTDPGNYLVRVTLENSLAQTGNSDAVLTVTTPQGSDGGGGSILWYELLGLLAFCGLFLLPKNNCASLPKH